MISGSRKQLAGKISVSRSYTRDGTSISIRITDANSRLIIFDGSMTPEDFGNAVTGLSDQDIDFSLYNSENIGKLMETKIVLMDCNGRSDPRAETICDQAEAENPGWKADSNPFGSQQPIRGKVKVILRRWVEEDE